MDDQLDNASFAKLAKASDLAPVSALCTPVFVDCVYYV
jgi:hypothetical protein